MAFSNMSPWLVAATAIAAAILFCGYLRLLIHLCAISASQIRTPRRRLSPTNEAADLSLQFRNLGLEASTIDALPVAQFTEENAGETRDCAVCLAEFKEGELLKSLPSCGHSFHVSCIDEWFLSHSSCPLCRAEVQKRIEVPVSVSGQPLPQSVEREEQPRVLSSGNWPESEDGN